MEKKEKKEVQIFNLTWVEVKEWLKETDIILIPLGSTEQHGPHLPTGIDSLAGSYVAIEAAKQAQVPVAPLLPVGYSPFHMRPKEPGTITLRGDTFFNLLYDVGRSLIYHGFRKLVYVTGHTANSPIIDRVVRALRYETGALAINYAADTEVFANLCRDLLDAPDELPGWHGGEIEASGALLFCPELVHMERAEKQLPTRPAWMTERMIKDSGSGFEIKYEGYPVRVPLDQFEYAENGIMGNPLLASKEKGEKIYTRMINIFVDFLNELKTVKVEIKKRDFPERY